MTSMGFIPPVTVMLPECRLKFPWMLKTNCVPGGPLSVRLAFKVRLLRLTTFNPGVPVTVRFEEMLPLLKVTAVRFGDRAARAVVAFNAIVRSEFIRLELVMVLPF